MNKGLKHLKVCIGILLGGAAISFASPLQAGANPIFLVTATEKAPPVVYPGQVVTANYTIRNNPKNPYTLYENGITELPQGIKIIGGSCSTPVFNLTSGQSCTIQLQIIADQLRGDVNGGPKVCNSLRHPVHCSAPPATEVLSIIKSKNPPIERAVLTINPSKVVLEPSGSSQTVTITNTGPVAASSVKVETSPGLGVTITGMCASPLSHIAPNNTCQLTVTRGSQEGTTSATIAGSNTNKVNLDITSATLTTLSVTLLSASPAIIGVNTPGATVDLSIENTGGTTAYNVIYTLPAGWHGVQAGSCGNIEPGMANACTLNFSATQPNLADVIGFSADNTSTTVSSDYIAFRYDGGLVFSISGTIPNATAKVVTEADQSANVIWSGPVTFTGALDPTHGQNLSVVPGSTNPDNMGINGPGNTYQILSVLTGVGDAPAAELCANYAGDGHTDWYLPAICEWSNLNNVGYNCSNENINDNLKQLGFGNITGNYYWSSNDVNDNFSAVAQSFSGNTMANLPKSANISARCVRAISY